MEQKKVPLNKFVRFKRKALKMTQKQVSLNLYIYTLKIEM